MKNTIAFAAAFTFVANMAVADVEIHHMAGKFMAKNHVESTAIPTAIGNQQKEIFNWRASENMQVSSLQKVNAHTKNYNSAQYDN